MDTFLAADFPITHALTVATKEWTEQLLLCRLQSPPPFLNGTYFLLLWSSFSPSLLLSWSSSLCVWKSLLRSWFGRALHIQKWYWAARGLARKEKVNWQVVCSHICELFDYNHLVKKSRLHLGRGWWRWCFGIRRVELIWQFHVLYGQLAHSCGRNQNGKGISWKFLLRSDYHCNNSNSPLKLACSADCISMNAADWAVVRKAPASDMRLRAISRS